MNLYISRPEFRLKLNYVVFMYPKVRYTLRSCQSSKPASSMPPDNHAVSEIHDKGTEPECFWTDPVPFWTGPEWSLNWLLCKNDTLILSRHFIVHLLYLPHKTLPFSCKSVTTFLFQFLMYHDWNSSVCYCRSPTMYAVDKVFCPWRHARITFSERTRNIVPTTHRNEDMVVIIVVILNIVLNIDVS